MATGDTDDIVGRLLAAAPPWFPDRLNAPILTSVLSGIGDAFSFVYSYFQFAKLQTRIATATGGWLDLIAWDYFGARFTRRQRELDSSFQPRLLKEILRPRNTRAAIVQALQDLTGRTPLIFEPANPGDTGAYGIAMGYGCAGFYGSLALNNQFFVTALRPLAVGVPYVGGYGRGGELGFGVAGEYTSLSQIAGPVTDDEIYRAISQTAAAGVTPWAAIETALPPAPLDTSHDITVDTTAIKSDATYPTADHA